MKHLKVNLVSVTKRLSKHHITSFQKQLVGKGYYPCGRPRNNIDNVYISYKNRAFVTPFVVCLDRIHNKIVISIRGSASIADFITDAIACPRSIYEFLQGM